MGGPLWTASEEDYFWTEVVPFSDKKIGHNKKAQRGEVRSWDTLAREMRQAMTAERAKIGEKPLREYTALMLAEHWDKNVMQDRISKFAKDHVQAYLVEMEREGGARWAKRQRRLGKHLPVEEGLEEQKVKNDGPRSNKRRRLSSESTILAQDPTPGEATSSPRRRRQKLVHDIAEYDLAETNEEEEVHGTLAPARGPSIELPSIRHLIGDVRGPQSFPGESDTRRRLFPSRPSGDDNFSGGLGPVYGNPHQHRFVDLNDNPYRPRVNPPVDDGHIVRTVREAVEQRMAEINDLVAGDINVLVEAEVRRQVDSILPSLVRDEVHRQLSSSSSSFPPQPAMAAGSEMERRATAKSQGAGSCPPQHGGQQRLMLGAGDNLAQPPTGNQHQPGLTSPAGRGGPQYSRLPPVGQFDRLVRGGGERRREEPWKEESAESPVPPDDPDGGRGGRGGSAERE